MIRILAICFWMGMAASGRAQDPFGIGHVKLGFGPYKGQTLDPDANRDLVFVKREFLASHYGITDVPESHVIVASYQTSNGHWILIFDLQDASSVDYIEQDFTRISTLPSDVREKLRRYQGIETLSHSMLRFVINGPVRMVKQDHSPGASAVVQNVNELKLIYSVHNALPPGAPDSLRNTLNQAGALVHVGYDEERIVELAKKTGFVEQRLACRKMPLPLRHEEVVGVLSRVLDEANNANYREPYHLFRNNCHRGSCEPFVSELLMSHVVSTLRKKCAEVAQNALKKTPHGGRRFYQLISRVRGHPTTFTPYLY